MACFTLHRLGEVVERRLSPVLHYCRCRVAMSTLGTQVICFLEIDGTQLHPLTHGNLSVE